MNIETKFNLGQHVWYMKDNKPVEVIVSAIQVFCVGTNQDYIKYNAKNVTHSVSWLDHTDLHERFVFGSKADLLASVFGEPCKGIEIEPNVYSGCTGLGGDCPVCGH